VSFFSVVRSNVCCTHQGIFRTALELDTAPYLIGIRLADNWN
jgi:hypothetical protein